MDKVSIAWANTGGNAPVWHQEVPAEIIKIYQSLLVDSAKAETFKRAGRGDMFIMEHHDYRQNGDFSFAIKSPASIPANQAAQNLGATNNFGP